ncbi:helix-turn-helix domain-containing protein [Halobacterium wangiae]|uniref:helix-turn-helix domain-containing protein n=1 Tax=Halobacterium wangiae TaxID=2902623 RepID=UPI001E4C9CB8|nr:helix-turn-helix domain-containing protein [Halobacterium wangiae]
MIIAEYTLDHPFLRETLQRVPGIEVTWEDSYTDPDGQMWTIAWIDCADLDVLDLAIADDPTVARPTVLTEAGGRRLYRFTLVGEGAEASIMPLVVEAGGVQLEITASGEGWRNRTRFPSREAFEQVYRFCLEHEVDFEFHRIYERSEILDHDLPALSDAQRATLTEAVDSGYLDIPRQSSLDELGERLGISESAASERFRRGVKNLTEQTIYPDTD